VAADLQLPSAAVTAQAVGLGLVHGCLNGVAKRQAGARALGVLDIMTVLFVCVVLVAVCVVALQRPWTRSVVRVADSIAMTTYVCGEQVSHANFLQFG